MIAILYASMRAFTKIHWKNEWLMECVYHVCQDWGVIQLQGALNMPDDANVMKMWREFVIEHPQWQGVLLDLSGLAYLDSRGLGILAGMFRLTQENQKQLWLVSPNSAVQNLLTMTHLNHVLKVCENPKLLCPDWPLKVPKVIIHGSI